MGGLGDLLGGLLGGSTGGDSGGGGISDLLGSLTGGDGSGSGGGGGGMMGALAPMLGAALAGGGLSKLLGGFKEQGMEDKVESWVGTGENASLSAAEVEKVVTPEQIDQVAQTLGVSHEEAAGVLADAIPDLVNGVSPDGQLPDEGQLDDVFGKLAAAGAPQG